MSHYIRVTRATLFADVANFADSGSKILGGEHGDGYQRCAEVFPEGSLIYKLVGKLVEKPGQSKKVALPFKPGQQYKASSGYFFTYRGTVDGLAVWQRPFAARSRLYGTYPNGTALVEGSESIIPEYRIEVTPSCTVYEAIED